MCSRRAIGLIVSALSLVALAGCGSRANFSAAGAGGDRAGSGSAGAGAVTSTGGGGGTGSAVAGTGGSAGTGTGTGGAGSGAGTGSGAGAGGVAGSPSTGPATGASQTGPGAAAGVAPGSAAAMGGAPVTVGFVLQDASGASAVLGSSVPLTSTQRQQQMAQWLVDYVNAHGGIAGRKIVPTFETISATSTEPQRISDCEAMTQDQHDQAVMDTNIMLQDDEWACFASNRVDYFGNVSGTDEAFMESHSPYVNTTYLGLNRQMYAIAHGAAAAGWYNGSKVGIILPDVPEAHTDFASVLAPQLAAVGVKDYDVRYITETDGSGQTSQTNNAVLAFSSEGISRVIFFHDILVYLQFTNQAQAEHYLPEYAFPDFEGAAGIAAFYGNSTVNAGSIAVSSSPDSVLDDNSQNVKNAGKTVIDRNSVGAGMRQCLDILSQESGVNFYDPSQSQDPDLDGLYTCDELFLFWDGANKVGASFTPSQFSAGLRQLGSTYQSTIQNSTDFSAGNPDGASTYRVGRYDASCSCFVKITDWIPVPA